MNCQAVQNKILALPDPRLVPDGLREHVVGCAACRAWAKQAARLEALLERLPVPAGTGKKAELLADLTRPEPIIVRPPAGPVRGGYGKPAWRFLRRNAAAVGSLAAAALVAGGAWWLFTGGPNQPQVAAAPTPKHPFLEKVVKRDVALAKARTPAERLTVLGGLADDLSAEARELARVAGAKDLEQLAGWFDKVVADGLVRQAGKVPEHAMTPDERKKLFGALAGRLGDTAAEAERLIGEVPPEAQPHLKRIAASAREGQKRLQG